MGGGRERRDLLVADLDELDPFPTSWNASSSPLIPSPG